MARSDVTRQARTGWFSLGETGQGKWWHGKAGMGLRGRSRSDKTRKVQDWQDVGRNPRKSNTDKSINGGGEWPQ